MSLKPHSARPIPAETARVAEAAFPRRNVYMRMRDQFGELYADGTFADLFPARGQPAESPACLALITVMQFAEGLSDRQAADAVRGRIDWKYTLGLDLTDPGFEASVLSEFRQRLLAGQAELRLFETLLQRLREAGLVKPRGRQRTDSTHVLAAIHTLNRLECVGETLRHALNTLAVVAPDWLRRQVPADWFERYGRRFEEYRLPPGRPERYALAEAMGADGVHLLTALYAPETPTWLREVPAVEVLRQVWVQQFAVADAVLRWRTADDLPPASHLICSPYDAEARFSQKRQTTWTGYKVHLTETCDEDWPHLITDVQTTPATQPDSELLPRIQADLAQRDLLPAEQLADAGYVTAEHLVNAQHDHQVALLGPVGLEPSWQAKTPQGVSVATYGMDWDAHRATCPQGQHSALWMPGHDRHGRPVIHIRFAPQTCLNCPQRAHCTQAATAPRTFTIRPQPYHEALQAARQRQTTPDFKTAYAARAGIEGTLSQGIRLSELRRSRYLGLAKTHLQHVITATAINLLRVGAWLADVPLAHTRRSPFAALAPSIT